MLKLVFIICLSTVLLKKTAHLIFTVFGGKMAREPRKKPLDFGDNRDQVLLGLVLW